MTIAIYSTFNELFNDPYSTNKNILHTCIGALHKLEQGHSLVSLFFWHSGKLKSTYLCASPENLSNLEASVEIIVVILPTLWSRRPRPDRRRDLRTTVPMTCFEEEKKKEEL